MTNLMRGYHGEQLILVEKLEGSALLSKVTCLLCKEVVYDAAVTPDESPRLSAFGIKVHFEIRHQVMLFTVDCNNAGCDGQH